MADVDAIEAVKSKKSEEAAAAEMWAQLMGNRQNSVLKKTDAVLSSTPVDSVVPGRTPTGVAQSIANANELRRAVAHKTVVARQAVQDVVEHKSEAARSRSLDDQRLEQSQDDLAAHARQIHVEQAHSTEFHQQESSGGSSLRLARNREEALAFLKARGHELLKAAGNDPVQIQETLDVMAAAGIEADRASELYQATWSMMQDHGLEATLAALESPLAEAEAPAAQVKTGEEAAGAQVAKSGSAPSSKPTSRITRSDIQQLRAAQDDAEADELAAVEWHITPVKT